MLSTKKTFPVSFLDSLFAVKSNCVCYIPRVGADRPDIGAGSQLKNCPSACLLEIKVLEKGGRAKFCKS